MSRYATLVLDVDSTLSGIEGIEWLSRRRGADVQRSVKTATEAAMRGDIPLESVYGERLALIRPTHEDIGDLAKAYVDAIAPGARDAIASLRAHGVHVVIVSGGLRQAILPLAAHLGVDPEHVHAVSIHLDPSGAYIGYDTGSPLWRGGGKPRVVTSLTLPAPVVALGDGITDAELKPVVGAFIAFTGFTRHARVVALADLVITQFAELPPFVLA